MSELEGGIEAGFANAGTPLMNNEDNQENPAFTSNPEDDDEKLEAVPDWTLKEKVVTGSAGVSGK